ncbi:MAG TPA: flagellar assembly protein FliX [Stellaceae bacterium]|nr:flagellar assembly protein FliX [Stellaceae bacterium]
MKIENNRPIRSSQPRGGGKSTASGDFAASFASETSAAPLASAPITSGVDALFALQELPDATAERRRATARGSQILDRLEDLKMGLLTGTMSSAKLTDLMTLARTQSQTITDPELRDLLGEIEVRAAVELAKLDQQQQG